MKFAFLVHPITEETRLLLDFDPTGEARRSWGHDLRNYCVQMHRGVIDAHRRATKSSNDRVRVVDELTGLISMHGIEAQGRLYEIPMDAFEILSDPSTAMRYVEEAVDQAACWGARIAGLGSMTGIIGGQGVYLAERAHIPVTTGDSLEVFAALENLRHVCREVEIDLADEAVAVVGIPSGIASAAAKILRSKCRELKLVALRPSSRAKRLAADLEAELLTNIPSALAQCRIVIAATSSGDCIDQQMLRPGSVVIDVAVPIDVRGDRCLRDDTLIVSGGLTRIPKTMALNSNYLWFHHGMVPSCLAETMTLALEERAECFSLGRTLREESISEIGRLARGHGFDFSRLFSFGLPLDESALVRYRKAMARFKPVTRSTTSRAVRPVDKESGNGHAGGNGREKANGYEPPLFVEQRATRAVQLHARHLDPVAIALGARSRTTKNFVRGEGVFLWDDQREKYLDFFAGAGALQLGHNPSPVADALTQALRDAAPGFCGEAVNPWSAALAERLVALAPENLEMVSFANGGSEAVEAALKLAILSTGRQGLLHLDRACHGQTLGALAVSGDRHQRQRWGLDLAGARSVAAEDLSQLEWALASRDYAALVVDLVGLEEGRAALSVEYVRAAAELCRRHGTLLIIDEARTGLGRTGSFLAIERYGILPDALTLGRSLGAGVVPLGAVLTSRELWRRAYGTLATHRYHGGTLAGGSLASAAGLALLEALERQSLVEAAADRGRQLRQGLEELCQRSKFARAVRGEGLLLGLEFEPIPDTLRVHWKELEEARLSAYLIPDVDRLLDGVPALFARQALLDGHRIHTQISQVAPTLLRIHPALTISAEEIARFLDALDICCREFEFVAKTVGESIAKAGLGEHRANRRSPQPGEASGAEPAIA